MAKQISMYSAKVRTDIVKKTTRFLCLVLELLKTVQALVGCDLWVRIGLWLHWLCPKIFPFYSNCCFLLFLPVSSSAQVCNFINVANTVISNLHFTTTCTHDHPSFLRLLHRFMPWPAIPSNRNGWRPSKSNKGHMSKPHQHTRTIGPITMPVHQVGFHPL